MKKIYLSLALLLFCFAACQKRNSPESSLNELDSDIEASENEEEFLESENIFVDYAKTNNLESLIPDSVVPIPKGLVEDCEVPARLEYSFERTKISKLYDILPVMQSEFVERHFHEGKVISKAELLSAFDSDEQFIVQVNKRLSKYSETNGTAENSYRKIYSGDHAIGEFNFYCGMEADTHEASGGGVYRLSIIEDDNVLDLYFRCVLPYSLVDGRGTKGDWSMLSSLPEIFYEKDGHWYWKNANESIRDLYSLMEAHDPRVPQILTEQQTIFENILANLEVDGKKIIIKTALLQ